MRLRRPHLLLHLPSHDDGLSKAAFFTWETLSQASLYCKTMFHLSSRQADVLDITVDFCRISFWHAGKPEAAHWNPGASPCGGKGSVGLCSGSKIRVAVCVCVCEFQSGTQTGGHHSGGDHFSGGSNSNKHGHPGCCEAGRVFMHLRRG